MQVYETELPGVLLIEPAVFGDARGFFVEAYQKTRYAESGIAGEFVQDNLSRSVQGTLRGMHYQIRHPQGKLVEVIEGEVFDVAVDLRRDSPTFGKWTGTTLSGENHRQFFLPPGIAHGFYVVSRTATFFYKCTDYYHPEHERTLLWNDPQVGVDWPMAGEPLLSDKDCAGLPFDQIECFESSP